MGTYTTLKLKRKSDAKKVNNLLKELGAEYEVFNSVDWGVFRTAEMEKEDIRFCNEDDEGRKQITDTFTNPVFPIDKNHFEKYGLIVGQYKVKISCPNDDEYKTIIILKKWILEHDGKEIIDYKNSDNIDRLINF